LAKDGKLGLKPGPSGMTAERASYVRLMKQGFSNTEICRTLGINRRTGTRWRYGRAVKDPLTGRTYQYPAVSLIREPAEAVSARYLSEDERITIADRYRAGHSLRSIAEELGRSPSTISREVRRNRHQGGSYRPHHAQKLARTRRQRPRQGKIARSPELREFIQNHLNKWWSPSLICRRLKALFPDQPELHLVHETIYQALYIEGRGGLRRELVQCLRTRRSRRRPNRAVPRRTIRFPGDVLMINDRPFDPADRVTTGHWEGDLIMGTQNRSAIATLVERSTRYLMLIHIPGNHRASELRDGLIQAFRKLPASMARSLTWDQGTEMSLHADFTDATGVRVYFCEPRSPWQRGTNENTNGLLRQYFPKGTNLALHSPSNLAIVADALNDRPRAILGDDTPAERFARLLNTHK
jgi:IS30 family transposase